MKLTKEKILEIKLDIQKNGSYLEDKICDTCKYHLTEATLGAPINTIIAFDESRPESEPTSVYMIKTLGTGLIVDIRDKNNRSMDLGGVSDILNQMHNEAFELLKEDPKIYKKIKNEEDIEIEGFTLKTPYSRKHFMDELKGTEEALAADIGYYDRAYKEKPSGPLRLTRPKPW